jgi:hypothetical protein
MDELIQDKIQLLSLVVTRINLLFSDIWGFVEFLLRQYSARSKEADRYGDR